jgi:hypothetical protein
MINRLFSISILSLLLLGCGSGDSGSGDKEKDLFSLWRESGGSGIMDLTGGAFGQGLSYSLFESDGSECRCDLRLLGDDESGNYILNSCFFVAGTSSNGDPGCNSYNHTGTYEKEGNALTVCNSAGSCTAYE